MQDKVILCGAGCGDSSLLTRKAFKEIQQADFVVADALISADILQMIHPQKLIFVGKRKGQHSMSQDEINDLLIKLARTHKKVLRLQGGDPFVFGRGMEEVLALEEAGIATEIIPGISSAIAIPARMNIPATHRHAASSFLVITASRKGDGRLFEENLDFLASFQGTIIVLMGYSRAEEICKTLVAHGKPETTPAALLSSVEIDFTKGIAGTLKTLPDLLKENSPGPPAIIVIGECAGFFRQPAEPLKIGLVSSSIFRNHLKEELDDSFKIIPIMESRFNFEPLDIESILSSHPQWLVFCSQQGSQYFLDQCRIQKADLRKLSDIKIACVGKATAKPFEEIGIFADCLPEQANTHGLAEVLQTKLLPEDLVYTFRSKKGNDALEKELSEITLTRRIDLYDCRYEIVQNPNHLDALVFPSPSSIDAYLEEFRQFPENTPVFCLSSVSASHLPQDQSVAWHIPDIIDVQSLAQCIVHTLNK